MMTKNTFRAAYRAYRSVKNVQLKSGAFADVVMSMFHWGHSPPCCNCAYCREAYATSHNFDAIQRSHDALASRTHWG